MAKILFNDELFNIPEAALNAASERIIRVLSSVMNGTGAIINFGGTNYNIDSTKLSTATNSFISHLGTVSGSGMKVSVGGVEYNIDSSKMSNTVSQIHEVLRGLHSGGDDSGLEMNEYGFYFGQRYAYHTTASEYTALTFFEDGSVRIIVKEDGVDTPTPLDFPAGTAVYSQGQIVMGDEMIYTVIENGTKLISTTNCEFILEPSVYDNTYPIEWNSMEVMNNPSFQYSTVPMVKVSNLTPSAEELSTATITANMGGQEFILTCMETEVKENCVGARFEHTLMGSVLVMSVTTAVTVDGTTIPESGFYVVDIGVQGYDADCTLSIASSNGLVMNEYGFYFDVPYVTHIEDVEGVLEISMTFFADGSVKIVQSFNGATISEETAPAGSVEYSLNTITIFEQNGSGDPLVVTVTNNGTTFEFGDLTYTLEADIGGDSEDSGLNEYGFYFDVPYVYYDEAMQTIFNWNFHADGSATYIAQHITDGDPIVIDYPAEDITYSQNQVEVRNTGNGTGEPIVMTFIDNGAKLGVEQEHLFQVAHPDAYDHCMTVKSGEFYGLGSVPLGESGESMVKVSQLTPSFNDLHTGVIIVSTPETNMIIPLCAADMLMQHDNFVSILSDGAIVVQSESAEISGVTLTKGSWSILPSLPAEFNATETIMWNDASDDGIYDDEFPIE